MSLTRRELLRGGCGLASAICAAPLLPAVSTWTGTIWLVDADTVTTVPMTARGLRIDTETFVLNNVHAGLNGGNYRARLNPSHSFLLNDLLRQARIEVRQDSADLLFTVPHSFPRPHVPVSSSATV